MYKHLFTSFSTTVMIKNTKSYCYRDEVDINLNIELESFLSSQALLGQTTNQVAEQVN
jgi:hypothetical protein